MTTLTNSQPLNYDYKQLKEIDYSHLERIMLLKFGSGTVYLNGEQICYINEGNRGVNITTHSDYEQEFANPSHASNNTQYFLKNYITGKYFIENEKTCVFHSTTENIKGAIETQTSCYILTNYGRLFIYKNTRILGHTYTYFSYIQIFEYNIWLPLDYIELIKIMKPSCDNIKEVLEKIETELHIKNYNMDDTLQKINSENKKMIKEVKEYKSKISENEMEINRYKTKIGEYKTVVGDYETKINESDQKYERLEKEYKNLITQHIEVKKQCFAKNADHD